MIKIICVGKMKESYWKEAIYEYQKRIQKYTKLEIIEVLDSGNSNAQLALSEEASRIEKHLQEKDYLITLEIEGKQLDSIEFSKKIDFLQSHYANLVYLIGGSYGIHERIKAKSNETCSFSKMTFPHQMFRVILLEQIYRSYRILNNESYHK